MYIQYRGYFTEGNIYVGEKFGDICTLTNIAYQLAGKPFHCPINVYAKDCKLLSSKEVELILLSRL